MLDFGCMDVGFLLGGCWIWVVETLNFALCGRWNLVV